MHLSCVCMQHHERVAVILCIPAGRDSLFASGKKYSNIKSHAAIMLLWTQQTAKSNKFA